MKKYASVRFDELHDFGRSKQYQFVTDIQDLKIGDVVVVHTDNGYKTAFFIKYDETSVFENPKWMVQKVDTDSHKVKLERERKAKFIKKKMQERRAKLEEIQVYKILAKEDEDMKQLLQEYNEIEELSF